MRVALILVLVFAFSGLSHGQSQDPYENVARLRSAKPAIIVASIVSGYCRMYKREVFIDADRSKRIVQSVVQNLAERRYLPENIELIYSLLKEIAEIEAVLDTNVAKCR